MKERIQVKHDLAENWTKAVNFIPLAGEFILYDGIIEDGKYIEFPKLKIGDGIHKLAELPFIQIDTNQQQNKNYEYNNGVLKIQ